MSSIGKYLIGFGVGSTVLSLFDYELSLLIWIDAWGSQAAWAIRFGMIIGGLLLMAPEWRRQREEQAATASPGPVR